MGWNSNANEFVIACNRKTKHVTDFHCYYEHKHNQILALASAAWLSLLICILYVTAIILSETCYYDCGYI
jgi:hypothetical protein